MTGLRADFRLARGDFRLDVAISTPGQGVTALFGRSGCGKTTLLRCLAGLERAAGGCRLGEEVWQDDGRRLFVPTHRRPIGYVLQEPSLFPHLSVRGNLEYGWRRVPARRQQVVFDEVVELLGLGRHLDRSPAGLSGGERQRVSVARALLTSPRLLLMDEPLSALDHASKQEILPYFERLHDGLRLPIVYVSHSPDEVARLADQMILLQGGRVLGAGPVAELLVRLDLPLARDTEAGAVIDGRVAEHDDVYGLTRIAIAGGRLALPRLDRPIGAPARVRIHARDVSLALDEPGTSSILNILPVRILEIVELDRTQVLIRLAAGRDDETQVLARITRRSRDLLRLAPGREVYAQVKAVALVD
ncbi:MAG: molybdenum ABC transporter ATP-binding protein [Chromatiaceae bacterium]|jgi:molybdate transport system ATP-binding protein|nr:molybdenum ABC transporter ATP-binding protein [Chromatiaceae bacterium]